MKKFFAIFAVAAMLFACEEPVPETTLSLDDAANATFNLSTEAAQKVVAFTTNAAWTAAADAEWITVTPAEGVAGAAIELTIDVAENTTFDNRAGKVTITAGDKNVEIAVNQVQVDEMNVGDLEILYVGYEGGEVELPVNHNIEYTVTSDADWAVVGETRALTTSKTIINVAKNTTGAERTATLLVEAAGFEYEVYLTQASNVSVLYSVDSTTVIPQIAGVTISDGSTATSGSVSIANWDGKLVVCPGNGSASKLVNKATGAVEGDLTLTGGETPYYVATDDAGNLVYCNRVYNNVWGTGFAFRVFYVKPGTTEAIQLLDAGFDRYTGVNFDVRGDVTKNACLVMPVEGIGTVEHTMRAWDVVDGVVGAVQNFVLTGFTGGVTSWYEEGWWIDPYNPSFTPMGTSVAQGVLMLECYSPNKVYSVATDGTCTKLTEDLFTWTTAASAINMLVAGDNKYVACCGANVGTWTWEGSNVKVFDATTMAMVANFNTACNNQDAGVYGAATSDVCMEAVEGGINVYVIANTTSALEAYFLAL